MPIQEFISSSKTSPQQISLSNPRLFFLSKLIVMLHNHATDTKYGNIYLLASSWLLDREQSHVLIVIVIRVLDGIDLVLLHHELGLVVIWLH